MPTLHLVADRRDDIGKGELPLVLGDLRVEDHLQEQIAELVLEVRHVAARDGIGDLMRFLDGIGRDALKALRHIPIAARLRVAETFHDGQQAFQIGNLCFCD